MTWFVVFGATFGTAVRKTTVKFAHDVHLCVVPVVAATDHVLLSGTSVLNVKVGFTVQVVTHSRAARE